MIIVGTDNSIKISRGDTANLRVNISGYTLQSNDIIYFAIKKNANNVPLVEKEYTNKTENFIDILFNPDDTNRLEFGKYYYDIRLKTTADIVTLCQPTSFEVLEVIADV